MARVASSVVVRRGAKRETVLVSYNDLDVTLDHITLMTPPPVLNFTLLCVIFFSESMEALSGKM